MRTYDIRDRDAFVPVPVQQEIGARLDTDPAFSSEATIDFNGALKRHFNIDLPVAMQLQRGEGRWIISPVSHDLAPVQDSSDGELSDADLDLVSGGATAKMCANPACRGDN